MASHHKQAKKARKPSDRGRLAKKFWEHKPAKEYHDALGTDERGRGIYVLYSKGRVYYIGLSRRSLRGRIRRHANVDRHKGKWDAFSFYQIGRAHFIKDVESLLLNIIDPLGNRRKGRFNKKHNLARNK